MAIESDPDGVIETTAGYRADAFVEEAKGDTVLGSKRSDMPIGEQSAILKPRPRRRPGKQHEGN